MFGAGIIWYDCYTLETDDMQVLQCFLFGTVFGSSNQGYRLNFLCIACLLIWWSLVALYGVFMSTDNDSKQKWYIPDILINELVHQYRM